MAKRYRPEDLIASIEKEMKSLPRWQEAHPMALGSWARGELSPSSDLDMIFLGPEDIVGETIKAFQQKGHKIRARLPEDPNDWTQGVESRDILSLLTIKPFTEYGEQQAQKQIHRLRSDRRLQRKILKDVLSERSERLGRFDSMTNFLEPNLKQGPGGLRDIGQALQLVDLLRPSDLPADHHALQVLLEMKTFLIQVRAQLHLKGYQDQLINTEQAELADVLGFSTSKDFMRAVSRALARGSFYSTWICEFLQSSPARRRSYASIQLKTPGQIYRLLKADSSILAQQIVRAQIDRVYEIKKNQNLKIRGQLLQKVVNFNSADSLAVAAFHSRWIDKLCPQVKHLIGYVQHDQYHRLTAEAHLLQAIREVRRIFHHPQTLSHLAWVARQLTAKDWQILSWTALYHDLAKGLPVDHSIRGEKWVREDFKKFGLAADLTNEVAFLVKNHLELSIAAFRKNPQDQNTWAALYEKGLNAKRLLRLAVFTAVDIRATNPEAWNEWKSGLLNNCVQALMSPEKRDFVELKKSLKHKISKDDLSALDPIILTYFSRKTLQTDLASMKKTSLAVSLRDKDRRLWIRFHSEVDRVGLFAQYVQALFEAGASIQQAVIQTMPQMGVYDFFQISSTRSPSQLLKRIEYSLQAVGDLQPPPVKISSVEVVSESEDEVVLSFKGEDQRGLLWAIARALQNESVSIKSARVHTWGRQVDDLIHIRPVPQLDELVRRLRTQFKKS